MDLPRLGIVLLIGVGSVVMLDAQKQLTVTSLLTPPYLMEKKITPENAENADVYEGFCKDLLEEISRILNINYEIRLAKDGRYGSTNGSWNGMVGELVRKEADLSCSDLTITAERAKVIKFTQPFMASGISLLMKRSSSDGNQMAYTFLKPFSPSLWALILVAFGTFSVLLFVVSRLAFVKSRDRFSLLDSFWIAFKASTFRGSDRGQKCIAVRLLLGAWYLFTLVIISFYISKLTTILGVSRLARPDITLRDLASRSDIRVGCVKGGATAAFFRNSDSSDYRRLFAKMQRDQLLVKGTKEAVELVEKSDGDVAMILETTTIEYMERRHCQVEQVGGTIFTRYYGLGMNKDSDLDIDSALLELLSNGVIDTLKQKWWHEAADTKDCSNRSTSSGQLSLDTMLGLFYTLLGFVIIALIIAFFRFFVHARRESKETGNKISLIGTFKDNMSKKPGYRRGESEDNTEKLELA